MTRGWFPGEKFVPFAIAEQEMDASEQAYQVEQR